LFIITLLVLSSAKQHSMGDGTGNIRWLLGYTLAQNELTIKALYFQ